MCVCGGGVKGTKHWGRFSKWWKDFELLGRIFTSVNLSFDIILYNYSESDLAVLGAQAGSSQRGRARTASIKSKQSQER